MRRIELNALLRTLLESEQGVSDLHFSVGKAPQDEASGKLRCPFVQPPLPEMTPFMTEQVALNLIHDRPHLVHELLTKGSCDCAYSVPGLARFRVNIFSQRGSYSVVLRRLSSEVPSIEDLCLPPVFTEMAQLKSGIVLVTGAPGTGRTTTLAALTAEINHTRPLHIVTLEDPIEFLHRHHKATVNQRELGQDFATFATGMRDALKQAPRVVVVGGLQDRETMEAALTAAETGHLVFSVLPTTGAGQTLEYIDGLFEPAERDRVRARLAEVLRYVTAQLLVPAKDGGRVAALEVLVIDDRVRELILSGNTDNEAYAEILSHGAADGMQTLDQHLLRLYSDNRISASTAANFSGNRTAMQRTLARMDVPEPLDEPRDVVERVSLPVADVGEEEDPGE